ncbi:MAG: hypothetical protein LBR78_02085 [Holosporales bacterium]|jgi:hypothetical protein|nr:hypothetical protein [Holosporales bacterium]
MRRLLVTLLIFTIPCAIASGHAAVAESTLAVDFEKSVADYSAAAKEVSKRQISPEDEARLVGMFTSMLEELKKPLNVSDVVLRYQDGATFPDMARHASSGPVGELMARFIAAIYNIYRILTPELITAIVRKSPLELVPLLRELHVFLQFVTANPRDYGHGVFTERDGQTLRVFASDEALFRIARSIMLRTLFATGDLVYKFSRLTAALCKADGTQDPKSIVDTVISDMKRSTADDSRISVVASSLRGDPQ